LEIPLHTYETVIKYIGGLHSYLHCIFFMFNPTNIHEVLVQANHLESSKGKHGMENEPPKFEKQTKKDEKKIVIVKKEKLTCTHCKRNGHDEDHCWKFHS
jgi:hypothetical protein